MRNGESDLFPLTRELERGFLFSSNLLGITERRHRDSICLMRGAESLSTFRKSTIEVLNTKKAIAIVAIKPMIPSLR